MEDLQLTDQYLGKLERMNELKTSYPKGHLFMFSTHWQFRVPSRVDSMHATFEVPAVLEFKEKM